MKRSVFLSLILTIVAGGLFAQNSSSDSLLRRLDVLHENDRHQEVIEGAEAALTDSTAGSDRAELLWRLARAELNDTDLGLYAGTVSEDSALDILDGVVARADEAIQEDPSRGESYFWKAAAMAQQGQIRGILNSLFMAGDINDLAVQAVERNMDISEAWFLLGQLYRELPGRPISFGNNVYAVSFGRLSVTLHEDRLQRENLPSRYYDYYIQLAESLRNRNWSSSRRRSRTASMADEYAAATDAFTRGATWEGSLDLTGESDRTEGRRILEEIIAELEGLPRRTLRQERSLELAREIDRNRW
jgi:hypothetical protein